MTQGRYLLSDRCLFSSVLFQFPLESRRYSNWYRRALHLLSSHIIFRLRRQPCVVNERLISFPRFGRTRVLDAAAALTPLAFGWGCQDGFVRDGCKVWGCFRVFSSPLTAQYAPNKQTKRRCYTCAWRFIHASHSRERFKVITPMTSSQWLGGNMLFFGITILS